MHNPILWAVVALLVCAAGCTDTGSTDSDSSLLTLGILSPKEGAQFKTDTSCTIIADVNGGKGVVRVDFYLDDIKFSSVFDAPYQFVLQTPAAAGVHAIHVKAFDATGNSQLSSVHIMIVPRVIPDTLPHHPSDPYPLPGAAGISTSPTLIWPGSDRAFSYDVYLDTASSPPTLAGYALSAASLSRPGLWANTTYYWKVKTNYIDGTSAMGNVWYFTTANAGNTPPGLPAIPDPADGAVVLSDTYPLSWSSSGWTPNPVTYDVYVGANNPPTTQIASGLTSRNMSVNGLSGAARYYWRVIAKDNHGAATIGPVWNFIRAGAGTASGDYFPLFLGKEYLFTYAGLDKAPGGTGTTTEDGTHRWKVVDTSRDGKMYSYTIRNIRNIVRAVQIPSYYGSQWTTTTVADTAFFTMTETIADHVIGGLPGIGSGIKIIRYHALSDGEVIAQTDDYVMTSKIKLNVGPIEFQYTWHTNNQHIYHWTLQ